MKNEIIKGIATALGAIIVIVGLGAALGIVLAKDEHKAMDPPPGLEEQE